MTIDSFLDYLRYERNNSEKTVSAYENDLKQFESFMIAQRGEFNSAMVDAEDIREWISEIMDKGLSSVSVNRKLSSLRSFFKYHVKKGEIKSDPTKRIVGPKNKKVIPSFVKEAEMDRLIDDLGFGEGFEGARDRAIVEIFYTTGIRLSELVSLREENIDFYTSTIKVTGKRNKQRIVPFGAELDATIKKYLKERSLLPYVGGDACLFVKKDGSLVDQYFVHRLVKKHLSKVVTLRKRTPHVLRHSFATSMLNNSAELRAVKELLGHVNISTTELYTHTTFEELKKAYSKAHPRA